MLLGLAAGCGGGSGGGGGVPAAPVTINGQLSTPGGASASTFLATGAQVTVVATVASRAGITSVVARAVSQPDGQALADVTLSRQGATDTYQGVINAPANTGNVSQIYQVTIIAVDANNTQITTTVGSFTVSAATPPPNPPFARVILR